MVIIYCLMSMSIKDKDGFITNDTEINVFTSTFQSNAIVIACTSDESPFVANSSEKV